MPKLVLGMDNLHYDDRIKRLGLMRFDPRRVRSDLIKTFTIRPTNGCYDITPEIFF